MPLRNGVENPQHHFKNTTRGNRLSTRTPRCRRPPPRTGGFWVVTLNFGKNGRGLSPPNAKPARLVVAACPGTVDKTALSARTRLLPLPRAAVTGKSMT